MLVRRREFLIAASAAAASVPLWPAWSAEPAPPAASQVARRASLPAPRQWHAEQETPFLPPRHDRYLWSADF
ncbi:MAG TPA: hypothetical protein VE996_03820 [Terriglobales bacterium]|nr:hypothetical protein [Terriglobales bacterium]